MRLVIFAAMAVCWGVAWADDLPRDTNEIKTLTVEQAESLSKHYFFGPLYLKGLTSLTPEAAAALAKRKHHLYLDGLITLSPEAARALAKLGGHITLSGLATISPEAAEALAKHCCELALDGLTTLTPEVAEALAKHKGGLSLNGLTSLTPEAAEVLAKTDSNLSLDGLTMLSDEAAEALSQYKGRLSLNGLTMLSDEAAKALAKCKGHLYLDGLTTLTNAELAAKLAPRQTKVKTFFVAKPFKNLTTLSPKAAEALAQHSSGHLHLDGLTTLSYEVAKALAKAKPTGPSLLPIIKSMCAISFPSPTKASPTYIDMDPNSYSFKRLNFNRRTPMRVF